MRVERESNVEEEEVQEYIDGISSDIARICIGYTET